MSAWWMKYISGQQLAPAWASCWPKMAGMWSAVMTGDCGTIELFIERSCLSVNVGRREFRPLGGSLLLVLNSTS